MRVVLDTNILISACLKPDGLEARVVAMALSGKVEACVTGAIVDEYDEVLRRRKFHAVQDCAESLLTRLRGCSRLVVTTETLFVATDEDDNRFLECVAAAGAEYLITGNLRHYPAEYGTARVVNARSFMEFVLS